MADCPAGTAVILTAKPNMQRYFHAEKVEELMRSYDCAAQPCRFLPADLPALYAMSDQAHFLRQVQSAQENTAGSFSEALGLPAGRH